jgi:hypothetical protein
MLLTELLGKRKGKVPVHTVKVGVEVCLHLFLTLALYGGKWSASPPSLWGKSLHYPLNGFQTVSGFTGE